MNVFDDLRFGWRALRSSPWVTFLAIAALGLGIGASTGVFSVVDALLVRDLPVSKPEKLVLLGGAQNWGEVSGEVSFSVFSYPLYKYLLFHDRSFEDLCAFESDLEPITALPDNQAGYDAGQSHAIVELVSGNYFQVLGTSAFLGRTLLPTDDTASGANPVAVLRYGYWQSDFGGNRRAVGGTIELNGQPFTIIGITQPSFYGDRFRAHPTDVWVPLSMTQQIGGMIGRGRNLLHDASLNWLYVLGRLRPGTTRAQARAELNTLLHGWLRSEPDVSASYTAADLARTHIDLSSGAQGIPHLERQYSQVLIILLSLTGLLVLVACADVASLLLARGIARRQEMAVRQAMGASRTKLLCQLLVESLLLAFLGMMAALLVALWIGRILWGFVIEAPLGNPVHTLNPYVLSFASGAALLTAVLFGSAPAWFASRIELTLALKDSRSSALGGHKRFQAVSRPLVTAQLALAVVLVLMAGLLLRSLQELTHQNLGIRPQHVLVVHVDVSHSGYASQELPVMYQRIGQRLRALPGVEAVGLGTYAPMTAQWSGNVFVPGSPVPAKHQRAWSDRISTGFFAANGMRILEGRAFASTDTFDSPPVAIVNQAFVRRYLGKTDPVGRHFGSSTGKPEEWQIVGVANDVRVGGPSEPSPPMFFLPLAQGSPSDASIRISDIELRTASAPSGFAAAVRRALAGVDPQMSITGMQPLDKYIANRYLRRSSMSALLSGVFGGLALVLACLGLYGVMAYSLDRRTGEIGIRVALGARPGDIRRMILKEALLVTGIGLGIGLPCAFAVAHWISNQFYGVHTTDPLTVIGVVLVIFATALAAGYAPAQHAANMSPLAALKHE